MKTTAVIAAALVLSGCQTDAGDFVMRKLADGVGRYCEASPETRAAARANLAPYLRPGQSVVVTCE